MKPVIMAVAAGLAFAASPAMAGCDGDLALLFACDVPEHGANIELCRDTETGDLQYSYWADGNLELQFTGSAHASIRDSVRGINGTAYGTAVANGDTFYTIHVDENLNHGEYSEQRVDSATPAVLQVYANEADFLGQDKDPYIVRRVCYPPSIEMDREWFGPG